MASLARTGSSGRSTGAIMRSAHFYGVNGIVICTKNSINRPNSAPLSAVTAKASSGALEIMDVYDVDDLAKFLNNSSKNGWVTYGTVAVNNCNNENSSNLISVNDLSQPLTQHPAILVIGSEGAGLRSNVASICSHMLYIPSYNKAKSRYIDSLNVNAATAVLLQAFLGH
ncbi:15645_t:CDS:2 [Acaulospora colombiana]|uniref:15645_t:CDS:1 n=1 Tax=Acaulospora colombiana TaxID=27376 RepID=A0ACA9K6Z4_9GLOM|nr:15645_t:CDS:2 [Acaulospora colombiana]